MTLYISPYRRISSLRSAMDHMLEETMNDMAPREREMTLAADVTATDDAYLIRALVPGLVAEDVNIEVLNNTITIRGEFKSSEADEETKYLLCELPSGRFSRTINLPTRLDPGKAEAAIKDGVLTLRVPKAEAHRPKTIVVKTA